VTPLPIIYSTIEAAAVGAFAIREWDLGALRGCRLLHRSLNDSYLVETAAGGFVLRLSRARWRSRDQLAVELAALDHLLARGIAAAQPVARSDGACIATLAAPEGERHAVLFRRAGGAWASAAPIDSARFGAAVAALHAASADLPADPRRAVLDLDCLLTQPLAAMRPFLDHRPGDREVLDGFAHRLRRRLATLPLDALDYGFCHGDLYEENALIGDEGVTLVDFDCSGMGWRAYDLAVFRWRWGEDMAGEAAWAAFRDGYMARRPLAALDLAAVPLFVPLRAIWLRGLHCMTAEDWGVAWLNEPYWDRFFARLAAWEALFIGK